MGCDNTLTSEKFQNFIQQLEIEEEKEEELRRQEEEKEQPKENMTKKQKNENNEEENEEEEENEIENKIEKITIINNQEQPLQNRKISTSKQIQTIPKQTQNIQKQIKTIPKQTQMEENLCINIYSGFVVKGLDFKDCVIKTQEELNTNLRLFISPIIPKIKKNDTGFNLDDEIYTNSIKINFNKYYILALKDVNKINKVVENNGDYVVFVNEYFKGNINLDLEKYLAVIVKKIKGQPKIIIAES